MFIDIPGKNYKVLDTHVTYGLVGAIKLAAEKICPDSLHRLNKLAPLPDFNNSKYSNALRLKSPFCDKNFIYFCFLADLFSDVYSIWCNQKVTVRPMTLSEYIYCSYRNESDPNYYDISDDCDLYSFLETKIKKCKEYCRPEDLSSQTVNLQEHQYAHGGSPLVKQRKPNWCGLYDTFGHTHTMTFTNKEARINMKKNNHIRDVILVGGSSTTDGPKTWAANALLRQPTQAWLSVGTRFLLEKDDSSDI